MAKLERDADAPYGRKADGTPRKKSGPPKGTRAGNAIPRQEGWEEAGHGDAPPASFTGEAKIPAGQTPAPIRADLASQISKQFEVIGGLTSLLNPAIGGPIKRNSKLLGDAYTTLALQDARVRRFFEGSFGIGAWGGALVVTAAVGLEIRDELAKTSPKKTPKTPPSPVASITPEPEEELAPIDSMIVTSAIDEGSGEGPPIRPAAVSI